MMHGHMNLKLEICVFKKTPKQYYVFNFES